MPVPLPVGTRLLHIGPQKTGTTTLQGAFHTNREALATYGVHYAGKDRQPRLAAVAAVEQRITPGSAAGSINRWPALVEEVRGSTAERVVISAEMFANATDDRIAAIVEAFGEHTHVVITARPLIKLLPSQWQQYVQDGLQASYEVWLDTMLNHSTTSTMTPRFWRRHRHDQLAERWAAAVGTENVTVIALDEQDRTMNLRSFELLLDLPEGTLVPTAQTNRSFSLPEIELIREVNRQYGEAGWPKEYYEKIIRFGMAGYLREGPLTGDEPTIVTPRWAVERVDEVAGEVTAGLAASGVNIVGDLANLRPPVADAPEAPIVIASTGLQVAARAVMGVVHCTAIEPKKVSLDALPEPERTPRVSAVTSTGLLRIVADRAVRRLTRRPRTPTGPTAEGSPAADG